MEKLVKQVLWLHVVVGSLFLSFSVFSHFVSTM